MSEDHCTECDAKWIPGSLPTWWSLNNYFGINGFFCSKCFDLVQHDAYKQPVNPGAYCLILLKQGVKK